jgi:hypothetical protein
MNHRPPGPSGAHTHNNSPAVDQSQQVSDQLRPIVSELNRLVDRLEHLAAPEEDESDAPAPPRGRPARG